MTPFYISFGLLFVYILKSEINLTAIDKWENIKSEIIQVERIYNKNTYKT